MAQNDAKRLLPIVARAFAELGYRRATSATLARHCGVRENVLYRVWPTKQAMFLAAIDYLWQSSSEEWRHLLGESGVGGSSSSAGTTGEGGSEGIAVQPRSGDKTHNTRGSTRKSPASPARRLLLYEATHPGEGELFRIVFAGLGESDDPEISAALGRMYRNYLDFIAAEVAAERAGISPTGRRANRLSGTPVSSGDELTAWAMVGLATVANIGRALGLLTNQQRSQLYLRVGNLLIDGTKPSRRRRSR